MKAEEQIQFLAELLDITTALRQLIIDYCRVLTAEDDGHCLEDNPKWPKVPF